VTKTISSDTLVFDVDLWHQFAEEYMQYPTGPIVSFNGSITGVVLADFLLGDVSSFTQGAGEIADVSGIQLGLYVHERGPDSPTSDAGPPQTHLLIFHLLQPGCASSTRHPGINSLIPRQFRIRAI
jgi:hypothetical protein